jgi:hypothetical protein
MCFFFRRAMWRTLVRSRGEGATLVRSVPPRRLVAVVQPAVSTTPSDTARHIESADIPRGICRCQASRWSARSVGYTA